MLRYKSFKTDTYSACVSGKNIVNVDRRCSIQQLTDYKCDNETILSLQFTVLTACAG